MLRAIEQLAIGVREGGLAIVVKNGEIVGEGHNLVKQSHDPTSWAMCYVHIIDMAVSLW